MCHLSKENVGCAPFVAVKCQAKCEGPPGVVPNLEAEVDHLRGRALRLTLKVATETHGISLTEFPNSLTSTRSSRVLLLMPATASTSSISLGCETLGVGKSACSNVNC